MNVREKKGIDQTWINENLKNVEASVTNTGYLNLCGKNIKFSALNKKIKIPLQFIKIPPNNFSSQRGKFKITISTSTSVCFHNVNCKISL